VPRKRMIGVTETEEFSIFDKKFYPGDFDESSIPQTPLNTPSGTFEFSLFSSLTHSHSLPSSQGVHGQPTLLEGPQFWPTSKPIEKRNARYSAGSLRNSKFTKKNFWKKVWNKLSNFQDSSAADGSKFFVIIKSKRRGSDQSSSGDDDVITLSTADSFFHNSPTSLSTVESYEDDRKSTS
ncbi:15745_t:CDS:1, partial [Acaulospora colombiana]